MNHNRPEEGEEGEEEGEQTDVFDVQLVNVFLEIYRDKERITYLV